MVEIKKHKHSIGQSAYHLVWRPKYNMKAFKHQYPRRVVMDALRKAARRWNIGIYEMEVMPNHVHLFVEVPPTMTVSFTLQVLKGGSSREFFERCNIWREVIDKYYKKRVLWSPGKFFRSVGCVTAEVVEKYIKYSNQWEFEYLEKQQAKLSAF